jgi:hypothetical protein
LNYRDSAPEAANGLGKLQADIAATENNEVFGQAFQIERFDMRHRLGCCETWQVGNAGTGPNAEEHAIAQQHARATIFQGDPNSFWRGEPCFAHDQLRATGFEVGKVKFNQSFDHRAFASGHARHVDLMRSSDHS